MANRLQHVLNDCINGAQSAFTPGCLISDNVLLAYEITHTLRHKRTGQKRYLALKVDMRKAYDRVEWLFLEKMMLKMGFCNRWVELIMHLITSITYFVLVNGVKKF